MRKSFILFFISCLSLIAACLYQDCFGQNITWQRTYRPLLDGADQGYGICPADSSNFYIGGFTAPISRYIYILKINKYGDTIWTKILSPGEVYAVTISNDNGCIFAGIRGAVALAGMLRSNGSSVWLRTFDSAYVINDIENTTDGGYLMCGGSGLGGTDKGYVCKIDSLGNIIWQKIYQYGSYLQFTVIKKGINGGYIIGGGSPSITYLANINETGNIIWEKVYILGYINDIIIKNLGYIFSSSYGSFSTLLAKTNLYGDTLLTELFQNTESVYKNSILMANQNKFYFSQSFRFNSKIFSLDTNFITNGQLTLQHSNPQSSIFLSSMLKAPSSINEDLICVGWTDLNELYNYDIYAARIDSALNPPPPISIKKVNNIISEKFKLYQNYPNPFNANTIIEFEIAHREKITVKLYDVLGKELETIVNEILRPGLYKVNFSPVNLSSGVYLYAIMTESYKETKKLIFAK